ncbi:MAG: Ubiquinone biosynthesis O-methyltransferase [Candidatus Woesearchaeota archaeon]|nr:Ubiquinone biosynthesis O-methyltransferase [Candidatus Woesearchaeota archaeon]
MSIIKKDYDKNYFENAFYKEKPESQRNRNRIRELIRHKKRGKLLEVGCGEGNFLKEAEKYFDIEGVEFSKYATNKAKRILGDNVSRGNIENISLQPAYYDVIMVFNLLEHLGEPMKTIKKLFDALKEGGILIGSVPNNFGIIGGLATALSNIIDKTHCSTYSPSIWHEYFTESGFNEVQFFGEITIGRNRSFYVKNIFWKFISFNLIFVCKK